MVWLLTFGVGWASSLQGALNRWLGKDWPLPTIIMMNGISFLVAALVLTYWKDSPSVLKMQSSSWWSWIPGLLGFFFVLTVPWAIARIGATSVFVCLIAAQISGGLIWDTLVEHQPASTGKWIGALLTLVGAGVVSRF